jgi:hypothetical protein
MEYTFSEQFSQQTSITLNPLCSALMVLQPQQKADKITYYFNLYDFKLVTEKQKHSSLYWSYHNLVPISRQHYLLPETHWPFSGFSLGLLNHIRGPGDRSLPYFTLVRKTLLVFPTLHDKDTEVSFTGVVESLPYKISKSLLATKCSRIILRAVQLLIKFTALC